MMEGPFVQQEHGVNQSILQVRDLRVHYYTRSGAVKAANGVTFDLRVGERLGLVGESGSGKSTIAMALMRLIKPPGRIEGGQVVLDGVSCSTCPRRRCARLRLRYRAGCPGRDELSQSGDACAASDRERATRPRREAVLQ